MCRSGYRQRLALKVQLSHACPRCVAKRCCEKCCCVPVSSRSFPCRLCDDLSLTPSTHHHFHTPSDAAQRGPLITRLFLPWVSHFPPLHPARLHIFNMRRAVSIAQSVCIGASSLV